MNDWLEIKREDGQRWKTFETELLKVLDEAIESDGAAKGNIQLYNRETGALQVVVQRGFNSSFLDFFKFVRPEGFSVCSRAFRNGHRVIIHDVEIDSLFAPYIAVARGNGFRAVQSTPLIGQEGSVIGVFSTHFPTAHHLSNIATVALDRSASKMIALINELIWNVDYATE